jgi:Ser/Thr protein kinase RdoA (MazF antagonist)
MIEARGLAPTPEVLLTEILPNYDLAGPLTCERIYSGCHEIFRIESADVPLILKLYRASSHALEEVEIETAALNHLGRRGIPVSTPRPCKDGGFVQALSFTATESQPAGERFAVLFGTAPGGPVSQFDPPCCRNFGRALAGIHTAADSFTGAPVRWDLEPLLSRPLRALLPLLEDRPADRDYLQELAHRLRIGLSAPPAALDWGFCHGDYRPANSHFDEATGVVTTFDFEAGATGYRGYDLGTFLYRFAVSDPTEYSRLEAAFLEGYSERRPLADTDRAAVPLFVLLRPLRILGNILQSVHKNWELEPWGPPQVPGLPDPGFFEQAIEFVRRWDAAYLMPKNGA